MDDNEALRRVQSAFVRGAVVLDCAHCDAGVHLTTGMNSEELADLVCHSAAFVESSTTDRRGRIKLDIVGLHVSGQAYKAVVVLHAAGGILVVTLHRHGGVA